MSYDVHITRRKHWISEDGNPISEKEWLDYIKADEELKLVTEKHSDGLHGNAVGVWIKDNQEMPIYWSKKGEIIIYGPRDKDQIKKMVAIAEKLGAKLQGDDGEVYKADGSHFFEESEV